MTSVVNWAELRKYMLVSTQRIETCKTSYWDKCAASYDENMAYMNELTKCQIDRLPLLPEFTVLDVGAGTGRLTIPVAKKVRHVTALEPSVNMLSILKANAKNKLVFNIRCINLSLENWLQDNDAVDERFDVVLASFSLFMVDLQSALRRMDNIATKGVFLFLSASQWVDPAIQKIIYGETFHVLPDYIYAYNMLYEIGISANVELWDFISKQSYADLDDAVLKYIETYKIPLKKEKELRNYLRDNLIEQNGKFWTIRKRKAAMIWWIKNQQT